MTSIASALAASSASSSRSAGPDGQDGQRAGEDAAGIAARDADADRAHVDREAHALSHRPGPGLARA